MPSKSNNEAKRSFLDQPLKELITWNWETIIFAAIILLAIITRFYDLGARVMSHDESLHTYFSYLLYKGQGFQHTPLMHGPFQFHLLALSYWLFGDSDFTARIPAVLFSIASIALLWNYRRYLGRTGTLVTAALFVVSPFMLYYGRYVRNEAFVMLFFVVSLWAVLRYLDTGESKYLYALTTMTVLHFTAKETSFIYTAQILVFLGFLFLYQVNRREWKRPSDRHLFIILLLSALALLIVGVGINAYTSQVAALDTAATVEPAIPGETPFEAMPHLFSPVLITFLGLAVVAFLIALFILGRGFGLDNLRDMRSFGLMILLFTLVIPHLSAFPVRAVGWNALDYSSTESLLRIGVFLVPMFIISALAGMWWNRKEWLINAGIFYALFTIFFTTVFTNGPGFFSGLVGSLGYWLEQQGVKRGSQPWYYYLLVEIPVYEYLAMIGSLIVGGLGLRHLYRRFFGRMETAELSEEDEIARAVIHESFTEAASKRLVLIFLGYWVVTSFAAYTIAGEKMPWLAVHIAMPMLVLTGWLIGTLIDKIDWAAFRSNRGWLAVLLLPVIFFGLGGVGYSYLTGEKPFSGQTLAALESTSTFLFALLAIILSAWGFYKITKDWALSQTGNVITLVFIAFLTLLTTRASFMATYINYDRATEYLVYAHSARGVKDVMDQVEDISMRLTDGLAIQVGFDDDVSWPFTWYLRNYPNQKYYGGNPTRELRDVPVIIVGDNNFAAIEPIVAQGYYQFDYIRMWWPNQDYFGLTWPRIKEFWSNAHIRAGFLQIWLNRDYSTYANALGRSDMDLTTWSPADRMRLYIRKDVAAELWDYGVGPASAELVVDPYEGKGVAANSLQNIFADQNGSFLFNGPRDVAVAPDGSIFVADAFNHRIVHLRDGQVVKIWGQYGSLDQNGVAPDGLFNEPWGIAVSPDGELVYVADTWNHRIQVFSSDGQFVRAWGYFDQTEDPYAFWGPRDVAVDAKGNLYVSNTGNKRITVFTPEGQYVTQFGTVGYGAGQFDEPVGIAVDQNSGLVFVADTWNQRIQAFRPNGAGGFDPVNSWDINGWFSQSLENKPYLAIDSNGLLYITDPELSRVLVYTEDGQVVRYFGDAESGGEIIGMPIGITADDQGGVWVVDGNGNRLLYYKVP